MNYPREASPRSSTISASITKSVFWVGGFLAGAFLWLEPAPGQAIHPAPLSGTAADGFVLADGLKENPGAQPLPGVNVLEGDALVKALKDLDEKEKIGEVVLIYFAGHGPVEPGVGEGKNELPAR
jgi:hypothetical protein